MARKRFSELYEPTLAKQKRQAADGLELAEAVLRLNAMLGPESRRYVVIPIWWDGTILPLARKIKGETRPLSPAGTSTIQAPAGFAK